MMRALLIAGLALAVLAYLLPRERNELVLTDGDRGIVDEEVVVRLKAFSIPTYPSGKPRQYVSALKWSADGGESWSDSEVSVNHPLRVNGWWIYQMSWSQDAAGRLVTQLSCVREPWFPLAVAGWILAVLGAAGLCWSTFNGRVVNGRDARSPGGSVNGQDARSPGVDVRRTGVPPVPSGQLARSPVQTALSWACALATVCLPLFIIGRAVLRPEPVPALQSWMMAPHVAAYAASYLLLLFAAFGIGRRFMAVGFLLMTVGLVLGAWWGKMAWGAWWQNDPKELWSLATWAVYACYFFAYRRPWVEMVLRILGAVFIILTLTWVNFSRLFAGLHSYA